MKIDLESVLVTKAIDAARSAIRERVLAPEPAVGSLRTFAEGIAKEIARNEGISPPEEKLDAFIRELNKRKIGSCEFGSALRDLQKRGNFGLHVTDAPPMTHLEISKAWRAFETILSELPREVSHSVYAHSEQNNHSDTKTPPPPSPPPPPPPPPQPQPPVEPAAPDRRKLIIGMLLVLLIIVVLIAISPKRMQQVPSSEVGEAPRMEGLQTGAPLANSEEEPINNQIRANDGDDAQTQTGTETGSGTNANSDTSQAQPVPVRRDRFDSAAAFAAGGNDRDDLEKKRNVERRKLEWESAKSLHKSQLENAEFYLIQGISGVRKTFAWEASMGRMPNFPNELAGRKCSFSGRRLPCELVWRPSGIDPSIVNQQDDQIAKYDIAVSEADQTLRLAARKFCDADQCN
jgi:hypothetical protein